MSFGFVLAYKIVIVNYESCHTFIIGLISDEVAKQLKDSKSKAIITVPLCHPTAVNAAQKCGTDLPIIVVKEISNIPTPPGKVLMPQ